jgi:hypothetical protein
VFALDSDFNRYFNQHENPRTGVFFKKAIVVVGGVPVETTTALAYERQNLLPAGTVAGASNTSGARYDVASRTFQVPSAELLGPTPAVPSIRSVVARARTSARSDGRQLIQNQGMVAFFGQMLGVGMTWLAGYGIERSVEELLRTKHAAEISAIHQRGQGVLVVVALERYAGPDECRVPIPRLVSINLVGGDNVEAALETWHRPSWLPCVFVALTFVADVGRRAS